jgi:hypothetical protein
MRKSTMDSIREAERATPVRGEVDVLVAGAGPAGIMAALAAAEDGLKVALVERHAFAGGNMTTGLPLLGFLSRKGEPIIAGLPQQFIDRLASVNAASGHISCPLHVSLTLVDPEAVKSVALEMLTERGVEIGFHSLVAGVVMDGDVLKGIVTEGKGGREAILGKVVIDCSGDGDVAFRSGVPCEKGDGRGGMQPPTLMFCLAGVDTEKLRHSICSEPERYAVDFIPNEYFGRNRKFIVVGLRGLIDRARKDGLSIPTERTILITALRDGEVWVNMTRVKGVDGTDTRSLSNGEIEARRQIRDIRIYLTSYVPGFEHACFTRTREDILSCRGFDDAIAVGSYPIDLHRPDDDGCTLEWCGDCYDIPYRSLVPLGVRNLLVAGRCISTTHEAMAAIRVMPTCMAMGQAAGRAASLAVRRGVAPAEIDVGELQADLLARGVFLRQGSAASRP